MAALSVWITGGTRSGKTTRLIEQFYHWSENPPNPDLIESEAQNVFPRSAKRTKSQKASSLILAANSDNRRDLVNRIWESHPGQYRFHSTTPLGLFQDEVTLFWPLLVESLHLKAQFPVKLRPEMEQELATHLWSQELETGRLGRTGVSPDRIVRQTLDLMQLAAMSAQSVEEIPRILTQGFKPEESDPLYSCMGQLLVRWRTWCLDRGFLTYSIVTELYCHLLSHPHYQQHLLRRYQMVFADDVDEYPAITRHLFEFLLDSGKMGAFTFNPTGSIRLGLGADPNYLAELQQRCCIEALERTSGLAPQLVEPIVSSVIESRIGLAERSLSDVYLIKTQSRADLLRGTAEAMIDAVKTQRVEPQDIAVIAPGLDAIARYTLREILSHEGIAVESLQEQRPLLSSPLTRALLTLLALIYPGNGRLVEREAIAEMLVVLSRVQTPTDLNSQTEELTSSFSTIDPVRAGLLADYCFRPHPQDPTLLEVTAFPRWDRLGYQATQTYNQILQWINQQRQQYQDRLIPSPVSFLDRAMQRFFLATQSLPSDQLAVLRELMETASHYWEVNRRLHPSPSGETFSETVGSFIQLLRRGVVSANPYPVQPMISRPAVTLATIFQYRANRQFHRYHFWLDVGSPLWLSGGASTLWGAPLFLRDWRGTPWTPEDQMNADTQRLHRILLDLLSRVGDRLYLCHSDLAVNGQDQIGPLLPLIHAGVQLI